MTTSISPVFVDVYPPDDYGHPNLEALVQAGLPWAGIGLKGTEGVYYPANNTKALEWFQKYWPLAETLAGDRYGVNFFRWTYHYFRVDEDPIKQADLILGLVDSCGGWGLGDLPPVVDVETAEQPASATNQQIIDGVTAFSQRIEAQFGSKPILYAGSYLRGREIRDHLGCQLLITAAYGSVLPSELYTSMGWDLESLLGWQYCGTSKFTGPKNYPQKSPLGELPNDLTAITIPGSPDDQIAFLQGLCG